MASHSHASVYHGPLQIATFCGLRHLLSLRCVYYIYLEPQTTIYKWLLQLDDSQSLHRKWLVHQTSIFYINGCLGFQVYIYLCFFRKDHPGNANTKPKNNIKTEAAEFSTSIETLEGRQPNVSWKGGRGNALGRWKILGGLTWGAEQLVRS